MPTAREALNRLKWDQRALDEAVVFYLHRGAPHDIMAVQGADILALRTSFFDVREGSSIPYHRVRRIELRGEVMWERRAATQEQE